MQQHEQQYRGGLKEPNTKSEQGRFARRSEHYKAAHRLKQREKRKRAKLGIANEPPADPRTLPSSSSGPSASVREREGPSDDEDQ
eukprot:5972144-Karenia_brevis.AAC.1